MELRLSTTSKDALVELVKLVQKQGMVGDKGGWKDFLKVYDRKFGASLSDPSKRSTDVLLAFLQTFKEESDLKFFAKVLNCHSNREIAKHILNSKDMESPVRRLVRLTVEHPVYPIEYAFQSYDEDWTVTKPSKKKMKLKAMLAVDCEMVLCEDGTEAVVKICVVDHALQVKLHEFVNPMKEVADYRTHITGVSEKDLVGITRSLVDIQKSMNRLLSRGAILIGHSLSNDLRALKIDHARVIDTSFIFKYDGVKKRPSLNNLCKSVLGYEVRKKGDPHNCLDDACAAMKLVLAKIKGGFDDVLELPPDDVPEDELAKLLLHRIPVNLPSEELHQIISGDFKIEVQPSKKGRGDRYSALAIFSSPQDAFQAFKNLQGDEGKDSSGRSQKSVSVQLSSGSTDTIYVRKMARDNVAKPAATTKRSRDEVNETPIKSKLLKTDEKIEESEKNKCVDHVEEIKWLKDLLSKRDEEISSLHKIVAALTRKQGL